MTDPASPYVVECARAFPLGASPDEVWSLIAQTHRFPSWWGWLDEFEADRPGLEPGAVLRGVVLPPVPYRLRVEVVLEHCQRPHRIDGRVTGDLQGDAQLRLRPDDAGTLAEVEWTLEMRQAPMRVAARLARPLLLWGHDRVVEATVAGFRRQLGARP